MGTRSKQREVVRFQPSAGQLGRQHAYLKESSDGTLEISTSRLPIPSQFYDADFAWVQCRLGAVSFFFAKADIGGARLRTRLEVRYAAEPFFKNFWVNSRAFHNRLREISAKIISLESPGSDSPRPDLPQSLPAEKDHSVWANIDLMSQVGNEACVDFFQLSPRAAAAYARDRDLSAFGVEAQVRIQVTSRELLRLLDSCEPIAATIEKRLKEMEAT